MSPRFQDPSARLCRARRRRVARRWAVARLAPGLAFVAALALALALTLGAAAPASAALTVDLVWTATTGDGSVGTDTIVAVPGDEITLDIIVTIGDEGVDGYSLSVAFDEDLQNELDLVETFELTHEAVIPCDPLIEEQLGPLPDCFQNFGPALDAHFTPDAIGAEIESTGAQAGLAESFEANTGKIGTDLGPTNLSFRVGRIVFLVTGNVATDGVDLEGSALVSMVDGYTDNALNFYGPGSPEIVSGFATVDVPEPGAAPLAGAALATLLALRRSFRRRVARPRT